jgi:pimeloyl-ACP methyl ester carboxylesterase
MRRLPLRQRLPAAALALAAGAAAGPASATELRLEACEIPGLTVAARCGVYEVFENREARSGRTIPLRVVVLPATGEDRRPDPIVPFAGGPGGSTVDFAAGIATHLAAELEKRDFLLVDYRGTGESKPLFCPHQQEGQGVEEALANFMPIELLDDCREALAVDSDLTQYTTSNIVDDVDEIRRALGYESVNLLGASYGSRAVLVYLRRHPEVVRTAVIEGVVPTDARIPLSFAVDAQAALDGWFRECAADDDCRKAFPDPAGDLATALARLTEEAPTIDVIDPETRRTIALTLSRNAFVQALRYMLYTSLDALRVPAFLRAAAQGNWEPMAQVAYSVGGLLMASIPDGLYLSVTCTEDVAAIGPNAAALQAGTFLGDFRLSQQRAACAQWVRGALPDGFRDPVVSEAPTLIVSGERDPVTPARWGYQVQEFLPQSVHLVVPNGGHGWFGLEGTECVDALQSRLWETGGIGGLDAETCRASITRPPFLLEIPPDEEVAMSPEELARYAGAYTTPGGAFRITLEVNEEGLLATIGAETLRLVPLGADRFKVAGEPPGDYYGFVEEEGRIVRIEILQLGAVQLTLERD